MSLKDDLLRNRKVFALLTASGADTANLDADFNAAPRKPAPDSDALEHTVQKPVLQSFEMQEDAPKTEIFSLNNGSRTSREQDHASHPVSIEAIKFPKLNQNTAPPVFDPVESLYHRLETEARRTSQLTGEEEY